MEGTVESVFECPVVKLQLTYLVFFVPFRLTLTRVILLPSPLLVALAQRDQHHRRLTVGHNPRSNTSRPKRICPCSTVGAHDHQIRRETAG